MGPECVSERTAPGGALRSLQQSPGWPLRPQLWLQWYLPVLRWVREALRCWRCCLQDAGRKAGWKPLLSNTAAPPPPPPRPLVQQSYQVLFAAHTQADVQCTQRTWGCAACDLHQELVLAHGAARPALRPEGGGSGHLEHVCTHGLGLRCCDGPGSCPNDITGGRLIMGGTEANCEDRQMRSCCSVSK